MHFFGSSFWLLLEKLMQAVKPFTFKHCAQLDIGSFGELWSVFIPKCFHQGIGALLSDFSIVIALAI
jgi:hypothetical protein